MAILHQAYCGRDGAIRIGRAVPAGALPIACGSRTHLRRTERGLELVPEETAHV